MKKVWPEERVALASERLQEVSAFGQLVCLARPMDSGVAGRMTVLSVLPQDDGMSIESLTEDVAAVLGEFLTSTGDLSLAMPVEESSTDKLTEALSEAGVEDAESIALSALTY